MKKSKSYSSIWITAVVLFLGSLLLFVLFRYLKKREKEIPQEAQLQNDVNDSTPDEQDRIIQAYNSIKQGLQSQSVTDENFIRLVVAQASLESDRFDSAVYRGNNNPFGMRHPKVRPTTSLGDTNNDGYANYSDIVEAAKDYYLWTDYNHLPITYEGHDYKTIQKFVGLLKQKGYFEDTVIHYVNGVKTTMGELISILNAG